MYRVWYAKKKIKKKRISRDGKGNPTNEINVPFNAWNCFFFLFFFLSFFLFHFSSIVTLCIISIYFLSSSLRPHVSFIQSGTNGSEVMPSESSLEIILFAEKGARVYFFSSRRSGASQPTLPRSLWTLFSPSSPIPFD